MLLCYFFPILISLLYQTQTHILIPPFLPDGYQNLYYEQKFRISQLDTAQFRISGLPKDMFWTDNGTIFGTPSSFGQWTINIAYDSLTQSGSYETVLTIKNSSFKGNSYLANHQQNHSLSIKFPENLIFQKNKRQEIQFRLKNGVEPIQWKFATLPEGVSQKIKGRLQVMIDKQGIYILKIQATDSLGNNVQACVTLNVQNSKSALTEIYADNTIYVPSQNVNRLLQITRKQTQVTRQLGQAALKLGKESQILKENEEAFRRVSNNLIQLQNEARMISQSIQTALRDKKFNEQRLKQAYEMLTNSQANLNFAIIEQQSNNNLLNDSQFQKSQAQITYNKAARDLQAHLQVLRSMDQRLQQKQHERNSNASLLTQKKSQYTDLAQFIVSKQKQLISINQQVRRVYSQVLDLESKVQSQQSILSQQENRYSAILNNLKLINTQIIEIQNEIRDLKVQKEFISQEISILELRVKNMKANELFNLQKQIQNNDLAIQNLLFEAFQQWNSISYQTSFINEYISQIKFAGCNLSQYPSVQGIFRVKQISTNYSFYQTESGHRILFGDCTQSTSITVGDSIVVSGHAAKGVIHADKIARQ